MRETKEQWYSRELLTARLAKERYEPISRDTLAAIISLIDETVVGKVSIWQARIAQLEAALADMTADYFRSRDELMTLKYPDGGSRTTTETEANVCTEHENKTGCECKGHPFNCFYHPSEKCGCNASKIKGDQA